MLYYSNRWLPLQGHENLFAIGVRRLSTLNLRVRVEGGAERLNVQKCARCPFRGPQHQFPRKKNGGGYLKNCTRCQENVDKKLEGKRQSVNEGNKENNAPDGAGGSQTPVRDRGRPMELTFDELLKLLQEHHNSAFELDAFVHIPVEDIEGLAGGAESESVKKPERWGLRRAQYVSRAIREVTEYRWK
ncbi:hypothetical protein BD410DRAFT_902906 [Rickenella mellea]|uniref:Uncharacterized protein n=1 Tax=Rickenella mellea TaxID=50990 RepID=A0A4Y7PIH0_9AGAM|nr:hypothetical protein BD410DRAFT_902906 [Rickenella mellea]